MVKFEETNEKNIDEYLYALYGEDDEGDEEYYEYCVMLDDEYSINIKELDKLLSKLPSYLTK